MEKMVGVLDKQHLRPMQKDSYLCMAKCCDSANTPADLQQWCVGDSRGLRQPSAERRALNDDAVNPS